VDLEGKSGNAPKTIGKFWREFQIVERLFIKLSSIPKKRTRSASTTSDLPIGAVLANDDNIPQTGSNRTASGSGSTKTGRNNKRSGGSRKVAQDHPAVVEGDDGAPPAKRPAHNSRAKTSANTKRAPASHASHAPGSSTHDHGTRRNNSHGVNGQASIPQGSSTAETSRAYRNSHAYVVSQQPLFTSWNLPDYLAHLEPMLPTDAPRPLEVRGTGMGQGGRESMELTMERGVKVKWPSKRMSVGDMNKRVRALVEWVGREQANAMDRGRRRDALEIALQETARASAPSGSGGVNDIGRDPPMILDGEPMESPMPEPRGIGQACTSMDIDATNDSILRSATMKMMEELMQELIGFQERFGPGVKSRDRERRAVVT
jgi:hypothetical protein